MWVAITVCPSQSFYGIIYPMTKVNRRLYIRSVVFYACTTCHDDERIICYRTPPGVSLTFGPAAFPPGFRVVLDVDTAPLPLAVAVWDYETLTDLDATAVPLGFV